MKNIKLLGAVGISLISFSTLTLISCDSDSGDSTASVSAFVPDTLAQKSFRITDGGDAADISLVTFTAGFFTVPGGNLNAVPYEYIKLGGDLTEVRYTNPNTAKNEVLRFQFSNATSGIVFEQQTDGSFSNDGTFTILDGVVR